MGVSFKYPPFADQVVPGFITVAAARAALLNVMKDEPFMSDQTFEDFNVESRLDFEDKFVHRLYNQICSVTPDYRGATNLVAWKDFKRLLRKHVLKSKPYLED